MDAIIELLIKTAKLYKQADSNLEVTCNELNLDPIACTVFASKGKHLETLPQTAHDAGYYLNEVVRLHGLLVNGYGMDNDNVRALWYPILNA